MNLHARVPRRMSVSLMLLSLSAMSQPAHSDQEVDSVFDASRALYQELHQHPELSSHEVQTALKIAGELRRIGFTVTEHIGGTGLVAVLENGPGPTVMLRTELDALPVQEKTGLPFASKVLARSELGEDVPVAHACGHDLHMASLVGTASILAHSRSTWNGTLILVGQPAEETISGAQRMVDDGLFSRFPKPDAAVALHVSNRTPAGTVAVVPGTYNTNADSLRITIYGKGGHGAMPHTTVDPIVISARMILALQTIASREVKPGEVAIVTVGYVHAGTKNNVIPDQAELGLTVRTNKTDVRKQVLAAIGRISKAEADAADAPRAPLIEQYESTDAVYNNPALTHYLTPSLEAAVGKENVMTLDPITSSEDFSRFVQQGVPGFYFVLGGANPEKYAEAKAKGVALPSNHSSLFAPDFDPALRTGIKAEVAVLRRLLNRTAEELRTTIVR